MKWELNLLEMSNVKCPKINSLQFSQSIIDSFKKRLPEPDLVKILKPLERRFWPQQHSALILYGETEVCSLAKTLGEPAPEVVQEFRDFKLENAPPGKTLSLNSSVGSMGSRADSQGRGSPGAVVTSGDFIILYFYYFCSQKRFLLFYWESLDIGAFSTMHSAVGCVCVVCWNCAKCKHVPP